MRGVVPQQAPGLGQPLVREGDSIGRLPVHMCQRQAIGIDDPIATGDRLKSPTIAPKSLLDSGPPGELSRE